jgi:hypothetical protein
LLICFSFAKSQCSSVYGMVYNSGVDWSLISVDRYSGAYHVLDTIPSLQTLVDGTSSIETDSNRYIVSGLDGLLNQHIYTIDLYTGKVLYQPVCLVTITDTSISDLHYDIKRKKIFAIENVNVASSYHQFSLVTINPYTGIVNYLDSIPGMRTEVGETTTLGIDSGRYYVMGLDNLNNEWFYALDVATGHVKYKLRDSNIYALKYDTVSKLIYGISDTGNTYYTWFFDKLNPYTGLITTVANISVLQSYVIGTPAFAQDSLQFYFIGSDSINSLNEHFYGINVLNGQVIRQPLFGNGMVNYGCTEYDPCGSSYCTNNFSEPICIATIDTATNKAEIIWGRTNSPPATGSYNIYKDTTSGFVLIHNQALHALSEYEDTNSYPADGPETYKLATVDSCGESVLSAPHTTIYLTTTSAPNVYILNWTAYVGFTPSKYRIFRGPTLGTLVQIDSVSSSILTYHDTLPPSGSVYLVEAVNPSSGCVPTASIRSHRVSSAALSGSFSNGYNAGPLIITGMQIVSKLTNLNIYPNPSNGNINLNYFLSGNGNIQITIFDELGQVVYDNTETRAAGNNKEQLNLENLSAGIYSIRLQTNGGTTVKKMVVMKK